MLKSKIIHCALSFFIFAIGAFNKIKRHMVINDIYIKISIKSLPGNGNMGLRKKDIKPYVENKSDGKAAINIQLE